MPSVIFEGKRYVKQTFQVQCLTCKTLLTSKHHRDFQTCPCGAVSVDGGPAEGSVMFNGPYVDKSTWATEDEPRRWLDNSLAQTLSKTY